MGGVLSDPNARWYPRKDNLKIYLKIQIEIALTNQHHKELMFLKSSMKRRCYFPNQLIRYKFILHKKLLIGSITDNYRNY